VIFDAEADVFVAIVGMDTVATGGRRGLLLWSIDVLALVCGDCTVFGLLWVGVVAKGDGLLLVIVWLDTGWV
jgi:hypothetical protein